MTLKTQVSAQAKKPASSKRAPLPRASDCTKTFLKDWERLSRSGRYDLKRLGEAMLLLIYRLDGNAIIFVRTGTHSELFEE